MALTCGGMKLTVEARNFVHDLRKSHDDDIRTKNYQIVMRHFPIKSFDGVELEGKELANDFIMVLENGEKKKVEFKNYYDFENSNFICLEQKSNLRYGSKGWTFKIDADYVVFVWHGKAKDCYLIVDGDGLKDWWRENHSNYNEIRNQPSHDKRSGETWRSSFSTVPIKDLPEEIILHHNQFVDLDDFWLKGVVE